MEMETTVLEQLLNKLKKNKGKKATIWVCVEGRNNSNHRNEL